MAGALQNATGLQRWDSPESPPLLALHGFTGDANDFAWLAEHSRESIDWWALNLPGHGNAHITEPDSLKLDDFLDAIEVARRKIVAVTGQRPDLFGYSMGGRIALHTASRNPAKWRSLITVGATPGISDPIHRMDRLVADEDLAKRMRKQSIEEFLEAWQAMPIIKSQESIPQEILGPMHTRRRRNNPTQLAAALVAVSTGRLPALWDHLSELDLPYLAIIGQMDLKFGQITQKMRPYLPNAELASIPGVGHCAHLEAPEAFLELLQAFRARLH
ncbi:2-succinyl-6-hydroxy-2,4-cyclohexadiene-1-carboxylate synthase [Cerasicoccus arenae]|uniref:2-succinyl-6-hydroxy-2,4-cyclohexadiene-1-carboxylate synthase n=1 Tax=Cerasicoccus arenae TaxID=424488 RepID=A0A8J3GDL8_9BACT|nr:2-succinyl-6-hydroxy-2,4-cyclohexadiene-1-carboxylate synthase [Cerasicoccus arenae]MBK1858134.1 2-succinyl-6-hydroxy-2,4-cyclohexadiene-1-carboxylate synthase [Cerasicoccus arenae]GHB96704.1 putative 2-succinyl-6-hydroxy-2,4-cyclohexadiene-1-carboxylate synthase [Cerasicoccus arenae]